VEKLKTLGAKDIYIPLIEEYDLVRPEDIERMYDVSKPDIVIHLAALAGGLGRTGRDRLNSFTST
jgi:GDP-L-fucose synthase